MIKVKNESKNLKVLKINLDHFLLLPFDLFYYTASIQLRQSLVK